jgi:hypothetical protein
MTLSDFRAGHHPIEDVGGATSTTPGSPAITQLTFLTCCAHYPGGSNRCMCRCLPCPCCLPRVIGRVGIRDFTFEACSSFTHVAACQIASPPKADICPEAPTQPVPRPSRSVATMLIDITWVGPPPTGELRLCGAPITSRRFSPNFENGLGQVGSRTTSRSDAELKGCSHENPSDYRLWEAGA